MIRCSMFCTPSVVHSHLRNSRSIAERCCPRICRFPGHSRAGDDGSQHGAVIEPLMMIEVKVGQVQTSTIVDQLSDGRGSGCGWPLVYRSPERSPTRCVTATPRTFVGQHRTAPESGEF